MRLTNSIYFMFFWRIGLFTFGLMLYGISVLLSMPTLYELVYVHQTIGEEWYQFALIMPMFVIGTMIFWCYQSIMKIFPSKEIVKHG